MKTSCNQSGTERAEDAFEALAGRHAYTIGVFVLLALMTKRLRETGIRLVPHLGDVIV